MELKVDIGFDQLLQAIKQLPADKVDQLKDELAKKSSGKVTQGAFNFQQFLLNGPVMDNDQYKDFKETRKRLSQWRTK